MSVIELHEGNFDEEVLKSSKPVLIDFWASWCGPCKMMSPVIDEIATEHGELKVCKVNVDQEQGLAMRFGVQSIPTFLVFKDGKLANQTLGAQPKQNILNLIG